MNILQMLGIQSPGIVSDDYSEGGGGMPPAPPQDMGAQPPSNVFQGLGDATGMSAPAPQGMVPQPAPQPQPAAAPPSTAPARSRSSLLDHIGRIADVFAQVGGASPLYQPTLDARQNRVLALGDHDRTVTGDLLDHEAKRADITQTHGAIATAQNALTGAAVKHLQAILAANPNADVGKVWPMLASQAGVPADQTAALGEMFASDPTSITAMAGDDDGKGEKYGGQPVYATDPDGNLHVFQAGLGSNEGRDILPKGWKPADPLKVVNTGSATVLTGTHSVPRILPNTEKPGAAADRKERGRESDNRNNTTITVAGMPARAKPGDAKGGKASMAGANMLLDNIENGFNDLHGMGALPGDNSGPVGNILGALGRTRAGQAVGEQAGNKAAQRRLLMEKDINSLQSEMIKSLPASATRTKFEQEIQRKRLPDPHRMDYATGRAAIADLRRSFAQAQRDAQVEISAKPGGRPVLRAPVTPRAASKPTVSNW